MACTQSLLAQDGASPGGVGNPPGAPVRAREYRLGKHGSGQLSVVITRQPDSEEPDFEDIVCKFFEVSASGVRKVVDVEISEFSGEPDEDIVQVGNFLRNGRKQVLVATVCNNTFGRVYDFDGEQVRTVYDTGAYDGRKYLYVRRGRNGQALIQEEFGVPGGRLDRDEFPAGGIFVKDRNTYQRLVRWRNGAWSPVKFRYIDKTDEAIAR